MIQLTRFNGTTFVLNCFLIETIEATPDTVITLNNGKKMVVKESVDEIISLVKLFLNDVYLFKNIEPK
ncbi:flagellar FlbD family protein [Microaerobacter geothermalis]|uniref:flagellar FlbD family protein n=1 Tax=Microaerobacter geothermalis TaxID=674972 RepID=UPI001F418AED|nr:flagellar FlbD family protein [Microaerobacter geothermalis]MCF6093830.1 flagellar FlbD family protein [Microaerobacter geothermalis]